MSTCLSVYQHSDALKLLTISNKGELNFYYQKNGLNGGELNHLETTLVNIRKKIKSSAHIFVNHKKILGFIKKENHNQLVELLMSGVEEKAVWSKNDNIRANPLYLFN